MKTRSDRYPRIPVATTLALSVLALSLIAPWTLAQDPDPIAELRRRAEQGVRGAQFDLAQMYFGGDGVPQDQAEAFRWLRLAAQQGHADGQAMVGTMYVNGTGVRQDDSGAFRWYRLAAAQGRADSQYQVGRMYFMGQGVRQDLVLAHMWFNIAGANGDEAARATRLNFDLLLTPAEIRRATELARECMASDYEDCGR